MLDAEAVSGPLAIDDPDVCDYASLVVRLAFVVLAVGFALALVPQFYEQGGTAPLSETGCFRVGPAVCRGAAGFAALELTLRRPSTRGRDKRRVTLAVKGNFMTGKAAPLVEFPDGSYFSRPVLLYSTLATQKGSYTGVVCGGEGEYMSISSKWTIGSGVMSWVFLVLRLVAACGLCVAVLVVLCAAEEHSETKVSVLVSVMLILTLRGRGGSSRWFVVGVLDLIAAIGGALVSRFAHLFLLSAPVRVGKAGRRMYNAGFLGSGAVACIGWFLAFASRWVSDSLTFYISAVGIVAVADVFWAVLVATLAWLPADESMEHRLTVYRRQFLVLSVALAGARASEAWLAPPQLSHVDFRGHYMLRRGRACRLYAGVARSYRW